MRDSETEELMYTFSLIQENEYCIELQLNREFFYPLFIYNKKAFLCNTVFDIIFSVLFSILYHIHIISPVIYRVMDISQFTRTVCIVNEYEENIRKFTMENYSVFSYGYKIIT